MHIADYYSSDIIHEALCYRSTICCLRVQTSFHFNSLFLINPLMCGIYGKSEIFNSSSLPVVWKWKTCVERIMYKVIFQFQTILLPIQTVYPFDVLFAWFVP
jgi:hypothetical protein